MINKHDNLCQCLLVCHQCSWLKVVTVIKRCRLAEERADLWLLYLLLHGLIHLTVWCHDSLRFHLPATYTHGPFDLSMKGVNNNSHKKFLHSFFLIVDWCTPHWWLTTAVLIPRSNLSNTSTFSNRNITFLYILRYFTNTYITLSSRN